MRLSRVHTVPVKKPSKLTYVRVHPSPEYRMAIAILIDEIGEMYAVHPKVLASVADEAKPMMLYTAVDEVGNAFLLPVGLPGSDGRTNAWWQSGHAAAAHAQTEWVRIVSDKLAGYYKTKPTKAEKGEPKWPEMSFEELLNMAFNDGRLIDTLDRSVRNWPMQSNGSEMLRLACTLATERGISVVAPVHDAVLIEAPLEQLDEQVAAMQEAMREASMAVLAGFELRSDVKRIDAPERFNDPRGDVMWSVVNELLDELDNEAAP